MNVVQKGIVTLLHSGVTGSKLELPEDFKLEDAFGILRRQSIVPLACEGAVNCGLATDSAVMQKMMMLCYQNLIKHENQSKALLQIFNGLEAQRIPYLPVKGCNLKGLYPKPELRPMGDADILIKPEDHNRIKPVMEALGFRYEGENDHVFEWRSEALFVELHKSLIPPKDEDYFAYYGSGWQLAKQGTGSRWDLSAEDAYIFIFTHFAKHYRKGGIGCRHVVDLFVYRRAYPEMDEAYICRELEKLHLLEFHGHILRTLDYWFGGKAGDDLTELITSHIFCGGNWGTMEAAMFAEEIKRMKKTSPAKNSKWKAILRALFPPISKLSYKYKIIRKCRFLLPVIWVVRWVDIVFFRPQKIKKRVSILRDFSDDELIQRQQALEAVGLGFDAS